MKKGFFFSKIIFITTCIFVSFLSLSKAQGVEIFGPSALYKEESYTFVLDRNQNIFNSDSKVIIYIYNPKLEISFLQEQAVGQASIEPFYFNVPENTLEEGDYFISIEAVDNVGKKRIVAQKDIGVLSNGKTWVTKNKEAILSFFAFVAVIGAIHHIAKDRELYAHLKRIKIEKKKKTKSKTKRQIKKRS